LRSHPLWPRARLSDPGSDAKVAAEGRRFARLALRVFILMYLTGGVMLLPGLAPRQAPLLAGEASTVGGAVVEARDALSARVVPTVDRSETPLVRAYVAAEQDTLDDVAKRFGVRPETIAYDNGLKSRDELKAGTALRIPNVDGALYLVKEGDSVESVAKRFAVEVATVLDANRLYFEPDNFTVGKEILVPVPSATYPDFQLQDLVARANSVARGAAAVVAPVVAPVARRLSWPVAGVITQYYSAYHTGVDVAAPYGTPIGASDDGIVSATGWVAVGGLRVCVRHLGGIETCYYHTSAVYVSVGQAVARGQAIAAIGLTGVTTGPHVHWEANLNGLLVNPLAY